MWGCSVGLYSLAESDMRACSGRQPIMQTIMAGKIEMVLPAMYMMNRFMGICFSGASATSQQRCRERGDPGVRDGGGGGALVRDPGIWDRDHPPHGQPRRLGGVPFSPLPPGSPSAHLLHEDFVALVDTALPQLPLGETQRPAALGSSAGAGRG